MTLRNRLWAHSSGRRLTRISLVKLRPYSSKNVDILDKDVNNYIRKSPHEHVLLRPGMYIGSVELTELETWVYDSVHSKMEKKMLTVSPALIKVYFTFNIERNRIKDFYAGV